MTINEHRNQVIICTCVSCDSKRSECPKHGNPRVSSMCNDGLHENCDWKCANGLCECKCH